MAEQIYNFPQEKIHVTTDQSRYVAGDTIWLRSWLVDAATHCQVSASRFVYVELINPFGEVAKRIKLRCRDNAFCGYLPLSDDLAEGEYTLTAYTAFMESVGKDYFFRKKVNVVSPYAAKAKIKVEYEDDADDLILSAEFLDSGAKLLHHETASLSFPGGKVMKDKPGTRVCRFRIKPALRATGVALVQFDNYSKFVSLPDADTSIDLQFFPEGGYLVPGTACVTAFKAVDSKGRGIDVGGVVVNTHGDTVASFASMHRGMGVLSFIPADGDKYTARVGETSYKLPEVNGKAAVLHVDNSRGGAISLTAVGNVPEGASVLALNNGSVIYADYARQGVRLQLPREAMGSGVVQFLLLDHSGNRLSERLAFANYADSATLYATARRYDNLLKLDLKHEAGEEADLAVAVLNTSRYATADTTTNIEAQLLLQSELKGYIEDPGYYFRNRTSQASQALEALLLTQGWTRYDVPKALRGIIATPSAPIEIGTEFTGVVKSSWKKRPLSEARIKAIAPSAGFMSEAETGFDGSFRMTGTDFPEDTKFLFQAFDKRGKNELNFEVSAEQFPSTESLPLQRQSIVSDESVGATSDAMWVLTHSNGTMAVTLSDVTITRRRHMPQNIVESVALKSYDSEYFEKEHITSYEEVLRKIPGLLITSDAIKYRKNVIAIIVDNVEWTSSTSFAGGASLGFNSRESSKSRLLTNSDESSKIIRDAVAKSNVGSVMTGTSMLSELKDQYPFEIIKSIDFIQPGYALMFGRRAGFAGALVLTTKDGSDIKWKQPDYLQIYTPLGYQKPVEFYNPKYARALNYDFGSTIYWNPRVKLNRDATLDIAIPADLRAATVLIEGVDANGSIVSKLIPIGQ